MIKLQADITEIFSSIQGEGIFIGAKQIFVRFKKCNLCCSFCDEAKKTDFKSYTSASLVKEIRSLDLSKGPHHSIAPTGGEPLLYTNFLRIFLSDLRMNGFKVYLETNGTLPDELRRIVDLIDIVAMDFKLPSSTGERPFWSEHREFIRIAEKKNVFVKAIVTDRTSTKDIEKAVLIVKEMKKNIPLILQPATSIKMGDKAPARTALLKFLEIGARHELENIRVIPQIHKILGVK